MRHSIRYVWAMVSRHDTTCSSIFPSTSPLNSSNVTSSARYKRFLPTRSASCSLDTTSSPYFIRTHSLFISAKFPSKNSTEAARSTSSAIFTDCRRYALKKSPRTGC